MCSTYMKDPSFLATVSGSTCWGTRRGLILNVEPIWHSAQCCLELQKGACWAIVPIGIGRQNSGTQGLANSTELVVKVSYGPLSP